MRKRRPSLYAAHAAALCIACTVATTQEPLPEATAQETALNAATVYRRAFAEMSRVLREDSDDPVDYPWVDEPSVEAYAEAPWPKLLEETAVARSLFAQAGSIERCRFDKPTGEGPLGDEVQERISDLVTMRTFVLAHAFRAVETQPGTALADLEALFACACHLEQQDVLFASLMAMNMAGSALTLCDAMLAVRGEHAAEASVLRRALAALEARTRGRSGPKQLAERAVADARKLLALASEEENKNVEAFRAAQARAIELIEELVRPLREATVGDSEKVLKATEAAVTELKEKYDPKQKEKLLESGSGEALAALLATLVAPNASGLFQQWEEHGEALAKTTKALRARLREAR